MLPPHKTHKPMPKKIAVTPRGAPAAKAAAILTEAEEVKVRTLKQKARVNPAPLRVLGKDQPAAGA